MLALRTKGRTLADAAGVASAKTVFEIPAAQGHARGKFAWAPLAPDDELIRLIKHEPGRDYRDLAVRV